MTVCIAAICANGDQPMVVGASDRMLTAGDVEFELRQTKTYSFTPNVVGLVAGDAEAQITLCNNTFEEIAKRNDTNPLVSDVADIFANQFAEYRRVEAERAILYPIGLNFESLAKSLKDMPIELSARLMRELQQYDLEAATIITGMDAKGAHIYTVRDPGRATCQDGIGFAAIGIGRSHAESQFMFSKYSRFVTFPRALLLTYSAKKRAEAAPGVGSATDLFTIDRMSMRYYPVVPDMEARLQKIYINLEIAQLNSAETANREMEGYVKELIDKNIAARQKETGSETPVNSGEVRADRVQS